MKCEGIVRRRVNRGKICSKTAVIGKHCLQHFYVLDKIKPIKNRLFKDDTYTHVFKNNTILKRGIIRIRT